MKKVLVFSILFVLLISLGFAAQIFSRGHSGNNLVEVIENPSIQLVGDSNFGHANSEIYVNVGGNVKNLSVALIDGSLKNTLPGTSPSNYGTITFGETANNIFIEVNDEEKTLQQAINEGAFLITVWDLGAWSACSESCGDGNQSRLVTCKTENGATVDDQYCKDTKPITDKTCKLKNCGGGGGGGSL
ncbi:thrombospondin type-1 domain-containing protein [archaeon]|nr:thrombospondin type-1 domain-containing protein [archaeon]